MTLATGDGWVLIAGLETSRYMHRFLRFGATICDLLPKPEGAASRRFFVKSSETIFRRGSWGGNAITLPMLKAVNAKKQPSSVVNRVLYQ
jgi:hypothetical protein